MIRLLTYTAVFTALFTAQAIADEFDDMLFAPAQKITADAQKPVTESTQTSLKPTGIDPVEANFDEVELSLVEDEFSEDETTETVARLDNKMAEEPIAVAPAQVVATEVSLTDSIEAGPDGNANTQEGGIFKGTWVEKLTDGSFAPPPSDLDKEGSGKNRNARLSLSNMMEENKKGTSGLRSNVSVYDVSGVMLRMSLPQVESSLLKRGFKLVSQKFEIPNFIKWRYEEQCRVSGVIGYERLASCVVKAAKDNKQQYVDTAKFVKFNTQEDITISFTSNFTNNKVYRVIYNSAVTTSHRGSGQKAQYLRDIKVYDFWRQINQKYGTPDNKEDVIWGMGGNKPYMKASTGYILLEDPMLKELDLTRMSREDQKFMNTSTYNF